MGPDRQVEREWMVTHQIAARGVSDPQVLAAMRAVPREAFVPAELAEAAFDDGPLPIGDDQTISQPYIVALMVEALGLRGGERVLEVGTGSGYAAAVLGRIAAEVHTVERIDALARTAATRLAALGCANIQVHTADGSLGWPAMAPYDAIVVAAAAPAVPAALTAQLRDGARLVMPVGRRAGHQELCRITRRATQGDTIEWLADVLFVPLLGAQGWPR